MSKQRVFVPPNIARLMSPEDRKANGIRTPEEEAAGHNLTLEREIHHQFGGWVYKNVAEDYYHSDPVKRPTIKAGLPDFGIPRDGKIIYIEFKVYPNKLSPIQEIVFERMGLIGNIIFICYSVEEAKRIVSKFFNLPTN